MSEQKFGIENLKPLVSLGIELGNVADKMGRSKGAARFGHLLMLTDEAMALGSVDFSKVKAEIKDLDESEKQQLKDHLKAKFDIVDDKLEVAIESGIDILR